MAITRRLIHILDRPAGRAILRRIATRYGRWKTGVDVEVLFEEGFWVHRVESHFFPDGPSFRYFASDVDGWPKQSAIYLENARDYWFQHYVPTVGDCVIDVGAGRGEDVLAFSEAVGESGRVLAIEAHPLSFSVLDRFCRLNHLSNVVALNLAVADQRGLVSMIESESWVENAISDTHGGPVVQVPAAPLDEICANHGIERIA